MTSTSERIPAIAAPPERQAQKIVFLFKGGRNDRLRDGTPGPSEFFYGYPELRSAGVPVDLTDESAFGLGSRPPFPWEVLSRLSTALFGLHAWAVHRLAGGVGRFAGAGTVIAVNNAYGLALSYLKARGRLRPAVVFVAMGLLGQRPSALIRRTYARILRHVVLATISRPERIHLADMLPGVDVHYVPFGVDHRFWVPEEADADGEYVLSVGNDPHRDYRTLVDAWQPAFPTLRVVTRLPVPEDRPGNVEVIAGDWRTQRLSDAELRDLVRGSRFVVVPVRDTLQPSGQSACLQAMACGKAVVLSDIAGLWDRDLMRDGENCFLVPPGDVEALSRTVRLLLDDPDRAAAVGRTARRTVEQHLNVDVMAAAIHELCRASRPQVASE